MSVAFRGMKQSALFSDAPASQGFSDFWSEYPGFRRVNKQVCARKWAARGLDLIAAEIIAYVKAMKRCDQWRRGMVPAPEVFINQSRWEADLPPDVAEVKTSDVEKTQALFDQWNERARTATKPPPGLRRVA